MIAKSAGIPVKKRKTRKSVCVDSQCSTQRQIQGDKPENSIFGARTGKRPPSGGAEIVPAGQGASIWLAVRGACFPALTGGAKRPIECLERLWFEWRFPPCPVLKTDKKGGELNSKQSLVTLMEPPADANLTTSQSLTSPRCSVFLLWSPSRKCSYPLPSASKSRHCSPSPCFKTHSDSRNK